jgi:hypothetical protein
MPPSGILLEICCDPGGPGLAGRAFREYTPPIMKTAKTTAAAPARGEAVADDVVRATIDALLPMYQADGRDSPDSVMSAYPSPRNIVDAQKLLIDAVVPGKMSPGILKAEELGMFLTHSLSQAWRILKREIERALPFAWLGESGRVEGCRRLDDPAATTHCILSRFYARLPHIRRMVIEDTRAAYESSAT